MKDFMAVATAVTVSGFTGFLWGDRKTGEPTDTHSRNTGLTIKRNPSLKNTNLLFPLLPPSQFRVLLFPCGNSNRTEKR